MINTKKEEGEEEKTMIKRGLFILFEGVDRVGKSTQVQSLTNHISNVQKLPTKSLRFPDRTTPIGQIINQYLQNATNMDDRALHLLFSSNRWEARDSILELLNNGTNIVVDRYSYSGVAYSAAKGIDFDWCYACEKGLPKPDLIFYLSMSSEDATKRGEYGGERYEKLEFQKKIKQIYEEKLVDDQWKIINANRSIDEISNEISSIFDSEFKKIQLTSIAKLE
ncbi:thymidylate kinase [Dictyostelium discoideum AX4]|uniref:Thymidylate kinase n=1 Tax=Dictyostelium discoideum TaxID=44689 RepID=KTHY_DICDI|nr:thymidylate kinase [Dictyostelium discoideum AX4]Q54GN2.1 RecName: Full=Thymidylate kinase; AltName: Full=dTMP kinase [Dictyostelium discoideum]EAL62422.1 thymidylate kinase [Dictyostelium discoideum AX4]|eukprot:XP_635930.1 thymidylate kinase [Dictyostelium discoideum AX4]